VHQVTDTNHRILGVRGQFLSNDNSPSSKQDGENREGVQTCVSQTGSDSTSAGTLSQTPFIINSSDRTSPSPLLFLVETLEQSTAAGQGELRLPNKDGLGIHERSSVVDSRDKKGQWPANSATKGRSGNHFRCLNDRLGCNLPEHEYRGFLDKTGENMPHKYARAEGSFLSLQDFCSPPFQLPHSVVGRQHNRNSIYHHKGGTHSWAMSNLAIEIWEWCMARNRIIHAEHIPGCENIRADMEFRRSVDPSN